MNRKYDCFFCHGSISTETWQGRLYSGVSARTECQLCQVPVCENCSTGFLLEIQPEERSEVFKLCKECAPTVPFLDTAEKVMQASPRSGFCYGCGERSLAMVAIGHNAGPHGPRPKSPGRISYCDICEVRLCRRCVRPFQVNGVLCPACFEREERRRVTAPPPWRCPGCGRSWADFPPERYTCPGCGVQHCMSCRTGRRLQGKITMVCPTCLASTEPL